MKTWIGDGCTGRLVEPADAVVSIMDHGFTVGDGVFETLKVTHAGPFAIRRHLDRLVTSARLVGAALPDIDHVRAVCEQVVAANAGEIGALARLRITWTSGAAPLGSDRVDADPTLVVAMSRQQPWPEATSIITIPNVRNPASLIAGAKSTSYGENVVALVRAHDAGASEAVLGTIDNRLCEGTGSNVFVVVDGEVLTPSVESGCLAGITRALVIEWFGASEVDLPLDVVRTADEVFITSSTRDVHPVIRADERIWVDVGVRSALLREEFIARAHRDIDP